MAVSSRAVGAPETQNPETAQAMSDATRECPMCAMEVDASADACPVCGYEAPRRKTSLQVAAWVMVLLLLWPALEGLMYLIELL